MTDRILWCDQCGRLANATVAWRAVAMAPDETLTFCPVCLASGQITGGAPTAIRTADPARRPAAPADDAGPGGGE